MSILPEAQHSKRFVKAKKLINLINGSKLMKLPDWCIKQITFLRPLLGCSQGVIERLACVVIPAFHPKTIGEGLSHIPTQKNERIGV